MILRFAVLVCLAVFLGSCKPESESKESEITTLQAEVEDFLAAYTAEYVERYYVMSQAWWEMSVRIVEGDDSKRERAKATSTAIAAFTGSKQTIEQALHYLERRDVLKPLQVLQLEKVLYLAAENPQTVPELVEQGISVEAALTERFHGFDFQHDGESISANAIDSLLVQSSDPAERLRVWEASKEVGKVLKEDLAEAVDLRNRTVQALDYDDFFAYKASAYGMSAEEMLKLNQGFVREVWPLYRELHTWARYELAERYGTQVPEMLPAHWLPNRWGQDWEALVTVEGLDLDEALADKEAEWIVRQAEDFYVSLGFDRLPESFWQKSSLYPVPPDADYKKNSSGTAWHLDFGDDMRILMSVEPDEKWWETTFHELGHIYYFMAYTRSEVPVLLRRPANRGLNEAIGTLLGQVSMEKSFLVDRGLISADVEHDPIEILFREALDIVVGIPWSAGVMTHFEADLYSGLAVQEYNRRWWQHVRAFQGIEPPSERGEEFCDACTKTHVINYPARYYDYAISAVILYQLRGHIAEEILGQDPHAANYWGRKEVGSFLSGILELGNTRDWREVMREKLGEEISATPMLAYFEPLVSYLKEVNQGRAYTLPETPEL